MILGPDLFFALKLADHSIGCKGYIAFYIGIGKYSRGNLSWDRNAKHCFEKKECDVNLVLYYSFRGKKIWKKMQSLHHLLYRKGRHTDLFRVCCVTFHSSSIWSGLTFQDHTRNGWDLPIGQTSFLLSLFPLFYVCYS